MHKQFYLHTLSARQTYQAERAMLYYSLKMFKLLHHRTIAKN